MEQTLKEKIQIGPSREEIIKKYSAKFREFPVKTKIKVLWNVFLWFMVTQMLRILYFVRILKSPEIKDNPEVDLRKYAYKNDKDENFLKDDDINFFNDNGYLPPFKVMEREEALKLNKLIREKVMTGKIVYGPFPEMEEEERKAKMAEIGLRDDLEARGWNRHFNIPEIYNTLSKDAITHRLASLFGRDVYLWRSQLLTVAPGGKGTALHQVTDFRFAMEKKVLEASEDIPETLINLTTWVALDDVDETNAAMILLGGSHKTNQFEQCTRYLKYYLSRARMLDNLLFLFVGSVSNDPHARFDIVNLFVREMERQRPDVIDTKKAVTLRMKAGEALVFSSRTIHGSHPNVTDVERMALVGRFTNSGVKVYPEEGEYRVAVHFKPHKPVVLEKYLKIFKVCSIEE